MALKPEFIGLLRDIRDRIYTNINTWHNQIETWYGEINTINDNMENITIGTVTTVENVGDLHGDATAAYNPATSKLDFGLPAGDKGPVGLQGDQGIQGTTGAQGIQGVPGPANTNKNMINNPNFRIWQLGDTVIQENIGANEFYMCARWYGKGNSFRGQKKTEASSGMSYIQLDNLTYTDYSTCSFGQFVPAPSSIQNKTLTLKFKIRIREHGVNHPEYLLVRWTDGSTNEDYFYRAKPYNAAILNVWQDVSVTLNVPTNNGTSNTLEIKSIFNSVSEDLTDVDIAEYSLVEGDGTSDVIENSDATEYAIAEHFFKTSYIESALVGDIDSIGSELIRTGPSGKIRGTISFSRMYKTPAIKIYSPTTGALSKANAETDGETTLNVQNQCESSFGFAADLITALEQDVKFHYVLDAEIY